MSGRLVDEPRDSASGVTRPSEGSDPLGRIANLSDGIFAVALTLLVLDLRTPVLTHPTDRDLFAALVDASPAVATFVLSFVVVGAYWLSHHRLFNLIKRYDRGLVYVNFALLLTICFIPYPTSVIGQYGQLSSAAIFYAASLAMSSLALTVELGYVANRPSLTDPGKVPVLRYFAFRALVTAVVFLGSIPVAVASPIAGELSWVLILPAFLVLRLTAARSLREDLRPGV